MKKLLKFPVSFLILAGYGLCGSVACGKAIVQNQNTVNPADTIAVVLDTTTGYDTSITYNYLALGDSYTIGQSVAAADRFPAQAVQLLAANNLRISQPIYIATTGWTTANLLSAIASQNPSPHYDLVTLLIGVNDQYQHEDTAIYRIRFAQCLQTAVQLAGNRPERVVVLSIPDYSVTPFVAPSQKAQVSMEIDWFNAIIRHVTLQHSIAYVDITPSTRLAATDPTLIAGDGLHPSAKEYTVWAQLLAPVVKSKLK